MKILYSSDELLVKIQTVLEDPGPKDRRVVLVAYVGGRADRFLPDPKGLEIVCDPKLGATSGLTLSRLKKRGADLYKSDHLHMKVYWSSSKGCVICSANASGNALGSGNLKEAGAWFKAGTVDIDRLLSCADRSPMNDDDLKRLSKDNALWNGNPDPNFEPTQPDFLEWSALGAGKTEFKLGWWTEDYEFSVAEASVKKSTRSYDVNEPYDFLNFKERQAEKGDWFLTFKIDSEGTVSKLNWMRADFVIEVSQADPAGYDPAYPYQAVQVHPLTVYPKPPFAIDKNFSQAFEAAAKEFGTNRIKKLKQFTPPDDLLGRVRQKMASAAN